MPGLIVLYYKTYELLALPALASTYLITIIGIRLTPRSWAQVNDRGDYVSTVRVFTKVAIVVHIYTVRPPPLFCCHQLPPPAALPHLRCAPCSPLAVSNWCLSGAGGMRAWCLVCDGVLVRDRFVVCSICCPPFRPAVLLCHALVPNYRKRSASSYVPRCFD